MENLSRLLTTDASGTPSARHLVVHSRDWDEIKLWSDEIYMPYEVRPTGKARRPDSQLYAAAVGGFTLSRFHYRIPIHVREFSRDAGMAMVLTSLSGAVRHWEGDGAFTETTEGEAYLVDTSHAGYAADFEADHLQLNLIFPHTLLAGLYERWHGQPADDGMWAYKPTFGGPGSSWTALLAYCGRCATELPEQTGQGALGRHLEEQIGIHLLREWERCWQDDHAHSPTRTAQPVDIERAEAYLRAHAQRVPTLSEVAVHVGLSVPALAEGFARIRQSTPAACLAEQRLLGVHTALRMAPVGASVQQVAEQWGFTNLIVFTASFQRRFGEWPSRVLRQLARREGLPAASQESEARS